MTDRNSPPPDQEPRLILRKAPGSPIGELVVAYRAAKALFAAASLNCFDVVASGCHGLDAISRSMGTKKRPTEVLLDALAATGFLRKDGRGYHNSSISERYLVQGKPDYLGDNMRYQDLLWGNWGRLGHVLRSGRVETPLDKLLSRAGGSFVRDYIRGMSNIAQKPAQAVAERIPLRRAQRLLDVGAGPGTFTRALLARHPGMRATVLDLPKTLRLTRRFLAAEIAAKRVTLRSGSYHKDSFGRGRYDLVLLSHVTHDEGERENRRLLAKACAALRPGGCVAIHDFMLKRDGIRPRFAALFSLHMLVSTRAGRVYKEKEYKDWMRQAGLGGIRKWDICPEAPNATMLLVGRKR
ncbi:MAG: methyltransferase [Elusimicrobiota bacterium]